MTPSQTHIHTHVVIAQAVLVITSLHRDVGIVSSCYLCLVSNVKSQWLKPTNRNISTLNSSSAQYASIHNMASEDDADEVDDDDDLHVFRLPIHFPCCCIDVDYNCVLPFKLQSWRKTNFFLAYTSSSLVGFVWYGNATCTKYQVQSFLLCIFILFLSIKFIAVTMLHGLAIHIISYHIISYIKCIYSISKTTK